MKQLVINIKDEANIEELMAYISKLDYVETITSTNHQTIQETIPYNDKGAYQISVWRVVHV